MEKEILKLQGRRLISLYKTTPSRVHEMEWGKKVWIYIIFSNLYQVWVYSLQKIRVRKKEKIISQILNLFAEKSSIVYILSKLQTNFSFGYIFRLLTVLKTLECSKKISNNIRDKIQTLFQRAHMLAMATSPQSIYFRITGCGPSISELVFSWNNVDR